MIYESWFWKRELVCLLAALKEWSPRQANEFVETKWEGESYFQIEKSIFFSAFIIRRLLESHKITTKLEGTNLRLDCMKSKLDGPQKITHYFGPDDILAEYDFENPYLEDLSPQHLTNEIIHSFALQFYVNDAEDDFQGFWVASEYSAYRRIIDVPLDTWIQFVQRFIDDKVSEHLIQFGEGGRKFVSFRK